MFSPEIIILMSLIVCLAFLIKGVLGFGSGVFATSFLVLFLDVKIVLASLLLVQLCADAYFLSKVRVHINRRIVFSMGLTAILGILLGSFLLSKLKSDIILKTFAVFIILFALYSLFSTDKKKTFVNKPKHIWCALTGLFGGVIDASIGTGGPPAVMYLSKVSLDKAIFRATSMAILFIFHISRLVAYTSMNLFTLEILFLGLFLLPASILGAYLGMHIHVKIPENFFKKFVLVVLAIVGFVLFLL